jgi:hypothetical protein
MPFFTFHISPFTGFQASPFTGFYKERTNMTAKTNQLDLTPLPASSRRELRDFYQFLLSRSGQKRNNSANKYSFNDLCGKLSWKGDAVATQRSIRDEW